MSIPNLKTNFKDDVLNTDVNTKRKYQQTFNSDGTVSLDDVSVYSQTGDNFGAQQVNGTNEAVNNIYSERVVDLDALELITEPGFFVDALAVKDAYNELNENSYIHTKGFLGGISSRIYDLKRYRDGTFELSAKLDSSQVSFTYSSSAGRYFALLTASLPDELSIDGTSWIFTGSIASSGIYLLTANSIQGKTLSFYLSADANPGEIEYMNIGIILKGRWK